MVMFIERNVCPRFDHRSEQKKLHIRDANPLLTGKKTWKQSKTKQGREKGQEKPRLS